MSQTIVPGLPAEGFVRMQQIVGDPGLSEADAARLSTPKKRIEPRAPQPGILPLTEQHVRAMVRAGQFPKPVKIGRRVALWRVEDVRAWIRKTGGDEAPAKPAESQPEAEPAKPQLERSNRVRAPGLPGARGRKRRSDT
jgi:hypothetical protein